MKRDAPVKLWAGQLADHGPGLASPNNTEEVALLADSAPPKEYLIP